MLPIPKTLVSLLSPISVSIQFLQKEAGLDFQLQVCRSAEISEFAPEIRGKRNDVRYF